MFESFKELKKFQQAEYFFLVLIAFFIPISWRLATYAMIGLSIATILKGIFEEGFKIVKSQNKIKIACFILIAFWIVYAVSFLYSDNSAEARIQIGKKLSFLLFSLFSLCSNLSYLNRKRVKTIIYFFIFGIFTLFAINFVWTLFDLFFNDNQIDRLLSPHKFFKTNNIVFTYVHRGYFSMMSCFGFVFCLNELLNSEKSKVKIFSILSVIFLMLIPFFITSRAGIICTIMTIFLNWIWLTFIKKERKIGLMTGSVIFVILIIAYFSFPESIERFTKTFNNIKDGKGDCRLTIRNANRYVLCENYLFGVGIGDRNDETVKSYERYKDDIFAQMKAVEFADNEVFEQNKQILLDSIHAKFENEYKDEVDRYIDSVGEIQNIDYSVLKKYIPEYQGIKHCIKYELNAHNQYNDTVIAVGIIGFIILIFIYLIPILLWIKTKTFDVVFFAFLFIFAFNSLFESVFERQMGIMFFTFFYFILFHNSFCQQTTDSCRQSEFRIQLFIKHLFDRISALVGLIILLPFILIIFIIHKIVMDKGRFLYVQERIGRYGKKFNIYKIRTMKSCNDVNNIFVTTINDERILPFGRWLRRTKLDEIVELVNVLRGEMSLVGPRPDVAGYADKLQGEDRRILELKPGITGPASLKYINEEELLTKVDEPQKYNDEIIYPDKVKINLDYYYNRTFWGDIKIILKTIFR